MGYNVDMTIDVRIEADKVPAALATLNKYFVEHCEYPHDSLPDALAGFGFDTTIAEGADGQAIESMQWQGGKMFESEEMFKLLAPFVTDNSHLTCIGEDGDIWGYEFEGGCIYDTVCKMVRTDTGEEDETRL